MPDDPKPEAGSVLSNISVKSGKFIFANGDVYEGQYELNSAGSVERHGFGTFTSSDGVVYSGNWSGDKMNGMGLYEHSPSGMRYEGQFVDGQFEGRGQYIWPDGYHYEGEFKGCKLEGHGQLRDPTGQVWVGAFHGDHASALKFKLNM